MVFIAIYWPADALHVIFQYWGFAELQDPEPAPEPAPGSSHSQESGEQGVVGSILTKDRH